MSTLQENLDALSTALPDVPGDLEALKAQAERAERAVVDFLNDLGEKDTAAAARLAELGQALAALAQRSDGERGRLESQMEAFEERLEAGLAALRDDQGVLSERVEGVGTAAEELKELVEGTSASVRAAEQEAVEELTVLESGAGMGTESVRAAFDVAAAEAEGLRGAVEECGQNVKAALDGLLQKMREVAEQARRRIDQTSERLAGLREAHEAEVSEQRARLGEEQREVVAELRGRIETDLRTRVDQSVDVVLAELSLLREEGAQAAETCRSGYDTLEGASESLREATRPLPPAIEAAKQAAVQVGLPWD